MTTSIANIVEQAKASVRQQLQAVDRDAAYGVVREAVDRLQQQGGQEALLQAYVYCVAGLVQHARYGGLTKRQIAGLGDVASGILQVLEIPLRRSPVSYLYSELYLAQSQAFQKNACSWQAAWRQKMSSTLVSSKQHAWQRFSSGVQAFRLGHLQLAATEFEGSLAAGLGGDQRLHLYCYQLRTHRLLGDRQRLESILATLSAEENLLPAVQRELAWEAALFKFAGSGQLGDVLNLVKRGKDHFRATFILEACLWSRAVQETFYSRRIRPVQYYVEAGGCSRDELPQLRKAVQALERCYDESISIPARLEIAGTVLDNIDRLETLDGQLLTYLAFVRWLARRKKLEFAQLVMHEYVAACFKMSQGAKSDLLGIAGDLLSKSWFITCHEPQEVRPCG